ncbi:glycolate dehydrogenase [Sporolactobacillus inulinus]|uniref:Glycolate dehydrogenase n=1 Tax=Sporolactobacillus inulinus TaxID=2078 RepID=A0A4Y1ZHT3_9BACL|nr:glycolate dehydrogenase [Sporolactobacillus inulinus]
MGLKEEKRHSLVKAQLVEIVGEENVDDSTSGRLVYSYDATPNFKRCRILSLPRVMLKKWQHF